MVSSFGWRTGPVGARSDWKWLHSRWSQPFRTSCWAVGTSERWWPADRRTLRRPALPDRYAELIWFAQDLERIRVHLHGGWIDGRRVTQRRDARLIIDHFKMKKYEIRSKKQANNSICALTFDSQTQFITLTSAHAIARLARIAASKSSSDLLQDQRLIRNYDAGLRLNRLTVLEEPNRCGGRISVRFAVQVQVTSLAQTVRMQRGAELKLDDGFIWFGEEKVCVSGDTRNFLIFIRSVKFSGKNWQVLQFTSLADWVSKFESLGLQTTFSICFKLFTSTKECA